MCNQFSATWQNDASTLISNKVGWYETNTPLLMTGYTHNTHLDRSEIVIKNWINNVKLVIGYAAERWFNLNISQSLVGVKQTPCHKWHSTATTYIQVDESKYLHQKLNKNWQLCNWLTTVQPVISQDAKRQCRFLLLPWGLWTSTTRCSAARLLGCVAWQSASKKALTKVGS